MSLLADANESGLKASTNRDFQRNTEQLAHLKAWQSELAAARQPTERAKSLLRDISSAAKTQAHRPGTKAIGASPLVMPEATLRELHEAVSTKTALAKPITAGAEETQARLPSGQRVGLVGRMAAFRRNHLVVVAL